MKLSQTVLAASLLAGMAGTAVAASSTVSFFDGATQVATLTWSTSPVETSFTLDFLTAPDASAFVKNVKFQGDSGTFTDLSTQTVASSSFCNPGCVDAGTPYNWEISFPTANNATRLTIGEEAKWTIGAAFDSFGDPSLIHINAYMNGQSIKLEGCTDCGPVPSVPEPETYALMLGGLGVVGFIARRRRAI